MSIRLREVEGCRIGRSHIVGAILGILLATAARIGSRRTEDSEIIAPARGLIGSSVTIPLPAGAAAYIAASTG